MVNIHNSIIVTHDIIQDIIDEYISGEIPQGNQPMNATQNKMKKEVEDQNTIDSLKANQR